MLIISKFPKSIAVCTKCPRGRHAARVFGTPEFVVDIYLLRLSMHCAGSITIMWSVNVFINDFTRGGSSRGAAVLQPSLKNVRQKIPPNGQTRLKSGFSCEISQHNHFRYFRHHFGSTFPRNPTNQCFALATTPLTR